MIDEEITGVTSSDPDGSPTTPEQVSTWSPPRLPKVIRHKLDMPRRRFADAYGLPVETRSAWERNLAASTAIEVAYLRLIERARDTAKPQAAE
jgi:DNA-binding transcriptional regulator YiaG